MTKHDSEENHAKNAQRLMDMCADDLHQHGDMSQVKMSNRTLNSFKRQVQKLKVRSDRKNMGARRTRANYTRQSLEIAGELVQEREGQDLRSHKITDSMPPIPSRFCFVCKMVEIKFYNACTDLEECV